jgi:hypothetical protein
MAEYRQKCPQNQTIIFCKSHPEPSGGTRPYLTSLSISASLFADLFTLRITGQQRSTSPAGCSSVLTSPFTSPNHSDQPSGSAMTGIRSWMGRAVAFALVVKMAKVRSRVPS